MAYILLVKIQVINTEINMVGHGTSVNSKGGEMASLTPWMVRV